MTFFIVFLPGKILQLLKIKGKQLCPKWSGSAHY